MIRGDHFTICVTSNAPEHLAAALKMAFAEEEPATHYRIAPVPAYPGDYNLRDRMTAPALILFRPYSAKIDPKDAEGWLTLPFPLDAAKAARFVGDWLASADRGEWPDVDGSVEPDAFTVHGGANMYRFGESCRRAHAIIVPECSVYGK